MSDMKADNLLKDIWYFACPGRDLKPGAMQRIYICNEPLVVGRTQKGDVFALRDVCPHRAAPLSAGQQVEEPDGTVTVECPYHGWRMRTKDGVCGAIPALTEDSEFEHERLRTSAYPVEEIKGTIWVYMPDDMKHFDGNPALPSPVLPTASSDAPKLIITAHAEGPYDEAVIGLVDPAHTTYVHQQWFWRRPADAKEKVKHYEPADMGFRMKAHKPSSNARAYKLIGGEMTTEIEFALPGTRLETIRNEKHTILGLTAITPHETGKSSITQMFFWDMPMLTLAKPLMYPLGKTFLGQDGHILREQNKNLSRERPTMMYVEDADKLAGWYMQVKRAWQQSRETGQAFENPVKEATLRWRT